MKVDFNLSLFTALFCLLAPLLVFSQAQQLDIISYNAPAGWTKTSKNGAVIYSNINKTTNGLCIITIYAATPSLGTPAQDFGSEWNQLVVKPFKVQAAPKTEIRTDDGWTTISGASGFETDGVKSFALLTVFSGYGKTASVFSIVNDQTYLTQLDTFMASIKLNKSKTTTNTQPDIPNTNSTSAAVQNNSMPGKFGHLIYSPIEGWKQTNYTNAVSFIPQVLPPGYNVEVRIMDSKPFSGSLQQAFAESWNDALQQLESVSQGQNKILVEKISLQGWEYIRGEGIIANKNNDVYYLNLFVVKLNSRTERMFAVSQKIKEMYGTMTSLNQSGNYSRAYDNLFYSVKFDDWKDKVSDGNLTGGTTITGMYAGLKLGNGAVTEGGGLDASYAVLFSNGQVYFETKVHPNGFDGLNTQAEADQHVRNWGTYTLQNGRGALTMPYGSIPLVANANGITLTTQNTPHQYIRLPSIDGAVFDGRYAFKDSDFSAKAVPYIIFTADGKFVDNGALNILYHNSTGSLALNPAAQPGSGTYQARNYSLIFNYSDGRRIQIAFSGLNYDKKNQSPAKLILSFNNDELFKK